MFSWQSIIFIILEALWCLCNLTKLVKLIELINTLLPPETLERKMKLEESEFDQKCFSM